LLSRFGFRLNQDYARNGERFRLFGESAMLP